MRVFGGLLLVLMFNDPAWACSCATALLCPSMNNSEAIFIGRVMSQENFQIQFTVEERFKGVPPDATSVKAMGDPLCGGGFEVGTRYVVFVSRLVSTPFISGCGMTDLVERSASTIEFLRNWASGKSQPKLRGLVIESETEFHTSIDRPRSDTRHLPDVEVGVRASDGRSYTTRTDSRGVFVMDQLPLGQYSITASLYGYESRKDHYSVFVPQNGCAELNIGMWIASRVAGTVLKSDGSPARDVTVELSRVQNGKLQWPTESLSDEDGRFEFRRVAAGTYVVGVNVIRGANSELPYPARYYPNATSSDSAEKIEINGPVQLENLTFRLGERLKTRNIEISVVWWDGTPVTNGQVDFDRERTPGSVGEYFSRYTNNVGLIRCSVLTDRQFKVVAGRLNWENQSNPVPDRQTTLVEPGDNPIRLKFTISKANDERGTLKPSAMSDFNKPCL